MLKTTILDLPLAEHAQILAALRRARYGSLLTLHILLLCAARRTPPEMAAFLFCSRSSVYRTVQAYRAGPLGLPRAAQGQFLPPQRPTGLPLALQHALLRLLATGPQAQGWCRPRWSCATLALTQPTPHGVAVSAETVRRQLHALGWGWKRAQLSVKDNEPCRAERLARRRWVWKLLPPWAARVLADALDRHLEPKVGALWRPKGPPGPMMPPGMPSPLWGARSI